MLVVALPASLPPFLHSDTFCTPLPIPCQRISQNKLAQASAEEKREKQAENEDKPKPTDAARAVSIRRDPPASQILTVCLTFPHSDLVPSLSCVSSTSRFPQNGNEPSRGAKIDEQIEKEEAELLRKKGIEP